MGTNVARNDIDRIMAEMDPLGHMEFAHIDAGDILTEYIRVLASPRAERVRLRGDVPRVNARIILRLSAEHRKEQIFSEFTGTAQAIVRWFSLERRRLARTVPGAVGARLDLGIA